MVSVDRAAIPAAGCIGPELRPCTVADVIREETLVDPPSVQVEALLQAEARAKQGAGFPVSCRVAEPMRTPPKRAPCRPGLAGPCATGRNPPTYRAHHTE